MYYNFLMASVGDGKYLQLPSSVTGFLYLWHLPHRNCATLQVDLTRLPMARLSLHIYLPVFCSLPHPLPPPRLPLFCTCYDYHLPPLYALFA
ncbi:hypothetical protein P692DRAFT_20129578 [Suillus brevipes Sb2]|nr:hypothetical protein P692DRAFT_20129578 [Suillus brevipes Sb2]